MGSGKPYKPMAERRQKGGYSYPIIGSTVLMTSGGIDTRPLAKLD